MLFSVTCLCSAVNAINQSKHTFPLKHVPVTWLKTTVTFKEAHYNNDTGSMRNAVELKCHETSDKIDVDVHLTHSEWLVWYRAEGKPQLAMPHGLQDVECPPRATVTHKQEFEQCLHLMYQPRHDLKTFLVSMGGTPRKNQVTSAFPVYLTHV